MSLKNEPFLLKTNVKHEYDKTQRQQGLHSNYKQLEITKKLKKGAVNQRVSRSSREGGARWKPCTARFPFVF